MMDSNAYDELLLEAHRLLHGRDNARAALDILEKATEAFPERLEGWTLKSDVHQFLQEWPEALAAVQQAIDREKSDVRFWVAKSVLHFNLRQYHESVASADVANSLEESANAWLTKSKCLLLLGDPKGALDASLAGLKVGQRPRDFKFRCDLYVEQSKALGELDQLPKAIEAAKQALGVERENETAWLMLSRALQDLGEYRTSLEAAETGLLFNPRSPWLWEVKALTLTKLNRCDEAIEAQFTAVRMQRDLPLRWFNLSSILINCARFSEAVSAINEGLDLHPWSRILWFRKASLLSEHPDHATGDEAYTPVAGVCRGVTCSRSVGISERAAFREAGQILRDSDSARLLEYRLHCEHGTHSSYEAVGRISFLDRYLTPALAALDWIDGEMCRWTATKKSVEKAKLNMAFGDPPAAYRLMEELDRQDDSVLVGQAYLLWARSSCLLYEDDSIEEYAKLLAAATTNEREASPDDCYYAGQILYLCGCLAEAQGAFARSGDDLAAKYMRWHVAKMLGDESRAPALLEEVLEEERLRLYRGEAGLAFPGTSTIATDDDPICPLAPIVRRFEIGDALDAFFQFIATTHEGQEGGSLGANILDLKLAVRETSATEEGIGGSATAWTDWLSQWEREPSTKERLRSWQRTRLADWIDAEAARLDDHLKVHGLVLTGRQEEGDPVENAVRLEERLGALISTTDLAKDETPYRDIVRLLYARRAFSVTIAVRLGQYLYLKHHSDNSTLEQLASSALFDAAVGATATLGAGSFDGLDAADVLQTFAGASAAMLRSGAAIVKAWMERSSAGVPSYAEFRELQKGIGLDTVDRKAIAWMFE